jgi:hypothetical protein
MRIRWEHEQGRWVLRLRRRIVATDVLFQWPRIEDNKGRRRWRWNIQSIEHLPIELSVLASSQMNSRNSLQSANSQFTSMVEKVRKIGRNVRNRSNISCQKFPPGDTQVLLRKFRSQNFDIDTQNKWRRRLYLCVHYNGMTRQMTKVENSRLAKENSVFGFESQVPKISR